MDREHWWRRCGQVALGGADRTQPADLDSAGRLRASMGACRSRTNADDRLPLASLGRVESGDGSFNAAETMFASPAVADHRRAHVPHNHSVTRGEILLLTGLRSPLLRFTWSDQKLSDR